MNIDLVANNIFANTRTCRLLHPSKWGCNSLVRDGVCHHDEITDSGRKLFSAEYAVPVSYALSSLKESTRPFIQGLGGYRW